MEPSRHCRAADPGSRAQRAGRLACALALVPALAGQPRASAQSRDADLARPTEAVPRGAPAPSTWSEAEARMDADGGARAVDLLLAAAAAGGWIETRRGELVALELAILRRVRGFAAERQEYWTERAGLPAAARLLAAGDDERSLARLVREMPATREAGLAALRLCDAALERGEAGAAADWLARAEAHGAPPEAVAARRALQGRRFAARARPEVELAGFAVRAMLERRLAGPRHQWADGAGRADGGCVAQHGDILCLVRPNASGVGWTLAEHDLRRSLEARHGLELPPAHDSSGMVGVARPALVEGLPAGALVVATAGRAEDERGNALSCWRVAEEGLELLWSSLDAAARAPELAEWTLEHSAFPIVVDGRVVELVRAWPDRVDDARVRTWLVSRALLDGRVLSTRLLDEGPVERAALREANALQPWRADQAPAPCLGDGCFWFPTGTGALWRVGLAQLEPLERLWSTPVLEPRAAASTVDGLGWAPREGGWRLLPALAEAGATEAAWPGLVELVGPGLGLERVDSTSARLARAGGSAASAPFAAPGDARPALLARPGRVWVASQGRAHLHDEALRRLHSVDLPGPAAGLPAGQLELGWIAVSGGAWLVRSGSLVFVGG